MRLSMGMWSVVISLRSWLTFGGDIQRVSGCAIAVRDGGI